MRKGKTQKFFLEGGPFNHSTVLLSLGAKDTMVFTAKGQTGRYVKPKLKNFMEWEEM